MNIFFISMGCAKNSVDSEHLIGLLTAAGHKIAEDAGGAQVGLINTCAFIQEAVKENVDAILDLELLKERGELEKIIVTGCLVNRYELELRKELPTVDLWARAEEWDKVVSFLGVLPDVTDCGMLSKSPPSGDVPPGGLPPRGILPENRPWSRYLKVGEGCDTFCSYCTIPSIRGRLRSTPIPHLAEEARGLCDAGARELCLVGQDLTVYGKDLYGEPALEKLLDALKEAVPPETWMRLLYLHPDRITRKFIDFLSSGENAGRVLPYLDVPIQHIDPAILSAMNRSPDAGHIREIFGYARAKNPFFALRTTCMVGFPGETEEQFENLLDFLEEIKFDRVGAFIYSPEEGTKAASLPGQVPDAVKEERYLRLMELQSRVSRERNELFPGRTLRILVEEIDADAAAWGRSYRDAPEVDGTVCVENGAEAAAAGQWLDVTVVDCAEHDLFAKVGAVREPPLPNFK